MNYIDFLLQRFGATPESDAMIWRDRAFSYGWLRDAIDRSSAILRARDIRSGTVVSLEADFSPNASAMLLALIARGCIIVPISSSIEVSKIRLRRIAEVETIVEVDLNDAAELRGTGVAASHGLIRRLRDLSHPGLVIFSSGSTGPTKAALHDFVPLLAQFHSPKWAARTISFLMFDHIGGINTLLSVLAAGGCIVTIPERSPEAVCRAIERHRVELLPTSPTFLNLLLLSEAYGRWDLTSLKVVSYGTEVMPESTLRRLRQVLPEVKPVQKFGLSELGILESKTRQSDALWLKIGGEGSEVRVVDGMLEIRTSTAMLGYLNAPSPFTPEGWFPTGDAVETDGEYVRILGRRSEMINIGGEKVFPAEIEDVLQGMDGVLDVVVTAERHPIIGQIAKARVHLATEETLEEFRTRMRRYCRQRLPRFKIPQKVELVTGALHASRFKKMRAGNDAEDSASSSATMATHRQPEAP